MAVNGTRDSDLEPVRIDRERWARAVQLRLSQVLSSQPHTVIARATGFSPETVRRYRTMSEPAAPFLASVAEVFGVDLNWLLCGIGQPRLVVNEPAVPPELYWLDDQVQSVRAELAEIRRAVLGQALGASLVQFDSDSKGDSSASGSVVTRAFSVESFPPGAPEQKSNMTRHAPVTNRKGG